MRKNERTFDKIVEAFVESVAIGDIDTAEGWLAVAFWSQGIIEKAVPRAGTLKLARRGRKT